MNQYEKGKHTPDIQTLKLIAGELDVPLNYFFCVINNEHLRRVRSHRFLQL